MPAVEIGLTPCSPRPAGELPACAALVVMEGGPQVGPQRGMGISASPIPPSTPFIRQGSMQTCGTPLFVIPAIQTSDTPTPRFNSSAAEVRLSRRHQIISTVRA